MGICIILMLAFIGYEVWKIANKDFNITVNRTVNKEVNVEKKEAEPEKKKEVVKETPKVVETTVKEEVPPPCIYGEVWRKMKEHVPWRKHRIKDCYLISNMGNIWDKERNHLVTTYRNQNDIVVTLKTKNDGRTQRKVKYLVATTFIGIQNVYEYKVVHKDGYIKNNAASNLRWQKIEKGGKFNG